MYLCYIDESGTSQVPGTSSHFVLAGLAIPVYYWKDCDREIETIKGKYGLHNAEIHVAWMLRPYHEQTRIPDFDSLDYIQRRSQVESLRRAELFRLQRVNPKQYHQATKTYRKTESYVHLTGTERKNVILQLANCMSNWGFARLFAECVDKVHFDPTRATQTIDEQSFEQVVSRFEQFLQSYRKPDSSQYLGLLIHDNNQTVAKKHTELMRKFHKSGTLWTTVQSIIETPMFVDSQLTSMVQVADICAYALRRYLENGEEEIFDCVFERADRRGLTVVGVRHYSVKTCPCRICAAHRRATTPETI